MKKPKFNLSAIKKPSININLGGNKKQLLIDIVAAIILIVLCVYIYHLFFATKPVQSKKATQQQTEEQTDGGSNATVPIATADTKINPFVEINGLRTLTKLPENHNAPKVASNGNLPAIPGYVPRPNVSPVPLPAIPGGGYQAQNNMPAPSSMPAARQGPAQVQGVFTNDDGSNTAIMSDGTVVSQGDTYNDGRIAYIGGDGVTFDDGHKLDYK